MKERMPNCPLKIKSTINWEQNNKDRSDKLVAILPPSDYITILIPGLIPVSLTPIIVSVRSSVPFRVKG
jgi:hypothetical protein